MAKVKNTGKGPVGFFDTDGKQCIVKPGEETEFNMNEADYKKVEECLKTLRTRSRSRSAAGTAASRRRSRSRSSSRSDRSQARSTAEACAAAAEEGLISMAWPVAPVTPGLVNPTLPPTVAEFRKMFPEFADVSDEQVQVYIDIGMFVG